MIVYGDHDEIADAGPRYGALCQAVARLAHMPPGIERHARLVGTLIDAGRLLQGVADWDFQKTGEDRRSAATDVVTDWLGRLSEAVRISWDSAFSDLPEIGTEPRLEGLPEQVRLRVPEGFAFYGVYPEAYLEAARRLKLKAPARVIGIRSIGTTLGAMVATALGARPPVSVRPFGDPFARQIAIDPELERELLDGDVHFIVVDEGPGQSGSSFGAVADWLEGHGVPLERIAFMPSHDGAPGPRAGERHRRCWERAQRVPASFGNALPRLLEGWTQPFLGRLEVIEDVSAGKWRQHLYAREEEWPAAVAAWERYK